MWCLFRRKNRLMSTKDILYWSCRKNIKVLLCNQLHYHLVPNTTFDIKFSKCFDIVLQKILLVTVCLCVMFWVCYNGGFFSHLGKSSWKIKPVDILLETLKTQKVDNSHTPCECYMDWKGDYVNITIFGVFWKKDILLTEMLQHWSKYLIWWRVARYMKRNLCFPNS